MKIGVMLRNAGELGGIWVYTTNLLNALLELDRKNEYVLIYRRPEHQGTFPAAANVVERVVPSASKLLWDQVAIPRLARREGLDLIFNPKLTIPLFARCRTVMAMHGAEQFVVPHVFKLTDRIYFTIANRLYCKRASAVVTWTHIGAGEIIRYMGAPPDRVHVIPGAYNERCRVLQEEEKLAVKRKLCLPDRYILFVGGINPLKNFGNLLKSFKKVRESLPHKLVAVGFKRWKYSRDLQLLDELGLRDDVVFTDFVADEDIPAIYNLAEAFVFPSIYEGFGMPVLEAMACGCPVITTKTGCSPEAVGDAALLVDPYDPDAIAAAIRRILTDEELRKGLIRKGFERKKDFSWKKCAREMLRLFESLQD